MAMKNIFNQKNVFFLVGIVLLFLGGSKAYVEMQFNVSTTILIIVGLIVIGIFAGINRMKLFKTYFYADLRSSILIGVISLALLAGLVGINGVAYRYNRQFDLTRLKQHTLTAQTKSIIGNLAADVKITIFYIGLPPQYLADLLDQFEIHSLGKIMAEIIDPLVDLGYAAQFGSTIRGDERKAFVQSGASKKEVDFSKDVLTEEQLANAVMRTMRRVQNVYFLAGHNEYDFQDTGETGLSNFSKTLLEGNIQSHQLVLGLKGAIPDDCDVLVISGPKEFLTDEESRLIMDYLDQGGDALFLIENTIVTTADKPLTEDEVEKNPSLNNILNAWGINISKDVVVDLSNHAAGDVGSPATNNYSTHRAMVERLSFTFYIRPRSITTVASQHKYARIAPLVMTSSSESSWGETNRTLQVKKDIGIDQLGPVPIAYVIWEPRGDMKKSDTRLVVFTDADFMTNAFIDQYSNKQMGVNVIQWLSELDYKVFAGKPDIKVEKLDLTSQQKRLVTVLLFAVPFCIMIAGGLVWMRRKTE